MSSVRSGATWSWVPQGMTNMFALCRGRHQRRLQRFYLYQLYLYVVAAATAAVALISSLALADDALDFQKTSEYIQ